MTDLVTGADGRSRCGWGATPAVYAAYHDHEWGRPVTDDVGLFERLCLEGFQAGLSWLTILRKREAFRVAFAGFDPATVAGFGPDDVDRLLADAGIVRHRGKIEAAIGNARAALTVIAAEGSLAALVWRHEPPPGPPPRTRRDLEASTEASTALSRELRVRGFRYVGPTTVHACFQAVGLVNDHLEGCWVRGAVERERGALDRAAIGAPVVPDLEIGPG